MYCEVLDVRSDSGKYLYEMQPLVFLPKLKISVHCGTVTNTPFGAWCVFVWACMCMCLHAFWNTPFYFFAVLSFTAIYT